MVLTRSKSIRLNEIKKKEDLKPSPLSSPYNTRSTRRLELNENSSSPKSSFKCSSTKPTLKRIAFDEPPPTEITTNLLEDVPPITPAPTVRSANVALNIILNCFYFVSLVGYIYHNIFNF